MVGALVGVTALIPVVGAFVGTIVGAIMILTVDPFKAVVFVIFLLILQQIEGNMIYPKVVGAKNQSSCHVGTGSRYDWWKSGWFYRDAAVPYRQLMR